MQKTYCDRGGWKSRKMGDNLTQKEYSGIAQAIISNDWEDTPILQYEKFTISQFESTAFDSDYQCYKVGWKEWEHVGPVVLGNCVQRGMVFKITNSTEYFVLQLLSARKVSVPAILAGMRCKQGKCMIFEQLIPGIELYGVVEHDLWKLAAKALSKVHLEFWNIQNGKREITRQLPANNMVLEKLNRASMHTMHNSLCQCYMREIKKRLESMPKTLIHGDMFPTNVIIDNNDVWIIDWADACVFAYALFVCNMNMEKEDYLSS